MGNPPRECFDVERTGWINPVPTGRCCAIDTATSKAYWSRPALQSGYNFTHLGEVRLDRICAGQRPNSALTEALQAAARLRPPLHDAGDVTWGGWRTQRCEEPFALRSRALHDDFDAPVAEVVR